MKKFLTILLTFAMLIGIVGCTGDGVDINDTDTETVADTTETEADSSDTEEEDDGMKYERQTVKLTSETKGVKILGVRNLASTDYINCDWSCSGVELVLNCKGDVSFRVLTMKSCTANNTAALFRAFVDGEEWINPDTDTPYYEVNGAGQVLLTDIPAGEHTVRLVKVTGYTLAHAQINSVTFDGEMSETAPADNNYYIEFVGDSITCAWGTIGKHEGSYTDQDGTLAYSYLVAKEQKADYSMTALSGQGLVCAGSPGMVKGYKHACYEKSNTEYDFARKADMVVVNIGTNDEFRKSAESISADTFKNTYKTFLEYIKEKNGANCKILCLYNVMNDTFSSSITAACAELGGEEQGIYYHKLDRAAGNHHPNTAEHIEYAKVINGLVTAIRAGTTPNPDDGGSSQQPSGTPGRVIYSENFDSKATTNDTASALSALEWNVMTEKKWHVNGTAYSAAIVEESSGDNAAKLDGGFSSIRVITPDKVANISKYTIQFDLTLGNTLGALNFILSTPDSVQSLNDTDAYTHCDGVYFRNQLSDTALSGTSTNSSPMPTVQWLSMGFYTDYTSGGAPCTKNFSGAEGAMYNVKHSVVFEVDVTAKTITVYMNGRLEGSTTCSNFTPCGMDIRLQNAPITIDNIILSEGTLADYNAKN